MQNFDVSCSNVRMSFGVVAKCAAKLSLLTAIQRFGQNFDNLPVDEVKPLIRVLVGKCQKFFSGHIFLVKHIPNLTEPILCMHYTSSKCLSSRRFDWQN
jgi:hypothetical protein